MIYECREFRNIFSTRTQRTRQRDRCYTYHQLSIWNMYWHYKYGHVKLRFVHNEKVDNNHYFYWFYATYMNIQFSVKYNDIERRRKTEKYVMLIWFRNWHGSNWLLPQYWIESAFCISSFIVKTRRNYNISGRSYCHNSSDGINEYFHRREPIR